MYNEILVPTDGGPAAETAVTHAIELAAYHDARIHALFVVDGGGYASAGGAADVVLDALYDDGEKAVSRVTEAATAEGVESIKTVTSGAAYRTITDYAADNEIDMIVMGTHGRRGLNRYLLGSVTERVVRSSDVPVLTVRESEE